MPRATDAATRTPSRRTGRGTQCRPRGSGTPCRPRGIGKLSRSTGTGTLNYLQVQVHQATPQLQARHSTLHVHRQAMPPYRNRHAIYVQNTYKYRHTKLPYRYRQAKKWHRQISMPLKGSGTGTHKNIRNWREKSNTYICISNPYRLMPP